MYRMCSVADRDSPFLVLLHPELEKYPTRVAGGLAIRNESNEL